MHTRIYNYACTHTHINIHIIVLPLWVLYIRLVVLHLEISVLKCYIMKRTIPLNLLLF